MVTTTKTLVMTTAQKAAPTVKITSPSQKPLPVSVTQASAVKTKNALTKPAFTSNLSYYEKGGNGHGGGAKPVGNHRAVARRS